MELYKLIFKSRKTRQSILKLLNWIPDKTMLQIQYWIKMGRKLNLKDPKRYTEKLQWYKLYYRNPDMVRCVDKYDVREYVKEKGLEEILNECYGIYDSAEDIDFDLLPEQFVIKDTLGGGGNNVLLCKDKSKLDIEKTKKQMAEWVKDGARKGGGREWPYYFGKKHRIIVERLLERDERNDLPDYKFFCFQGKAFCLYTMVNYTDNHENGQLGFYDTEFQKMSYCRRDFHDIDFEIEKPENFDKMIRYAEILAEEFPHARIDFYNINGKIVFGEITFFQASGYNKFNPDEFDYILGEKFVLPQKTESDV